jgi:coenzyme Q-binding protein COQ10
MAGASRSIIINTPPEKLFDVITQYEKYPEFLSEVKKIRVLERKENTVKVQYEVDIIKTIRYTILVTEERPKRMSWTFVEGEVMKDNKGSWVLEPDGQGRTKATYTAELALGPLVPKAIVNTLTESSLPKMLESFKRRAEGT